MKKHLASALLLLLLSGCESKDYSGPDVPGNILTVYGSIIEPQSRASGTQWDDDDRIGVSLADMGEYSSDTNIEYKYSSSDNRFLPVDLNIYIKGERQTVLAYYPYSGQPNTTPADIPVSTTAAFQTAAGQKSIDYLFASAEALRDDPKVNLEFKHVMSQLEITFQPDQVVSQHVDFTLSGAVLDGVFSPVTGVVSYDQDDYPSDLTASTSNLKSTFLLIPQEQELEVSLYYENKLYVGKTVLKLEAGYSHPLTVKINSNTENPYLEILVGNITDWKPGTGGNIDAGENSVDGEISTGENSNWQEGQGGDINPELIQ